MKLDGVPWKADVVYITTAGGPDWWEGDDEKLYVVTISATKFLNGPEDTENVEYLGIAIIVSEDGFTNPKGNYPAPPP